MVSIGTIIGDRYEILEKVGSGGMADVFRAKCHRLNRYVAIKILKQDYSEDTKFVTKFRGEAQAIAGISHPNIVGIYDVGEENGMYYIVMELVDGITLKKILIFLIKCYRKYISPMKTTRCPYYPTCSTYGLEAVEKYGAWKGGLLALWRILRCNPFSKGGYDPVP